ncbi:helix-turn-helix domain-containing protein, partial [Streptosporangium amethystogenes]|uniref:helix-turn-helix domain-containing protein n=1 Tax=Streptosporangium amethystogenes TaxID=2002 RepID=UPI003CCC2C85
MSVVEQRYRAVLAVLAGGSVTEVAREVGVARQTLSGWVSRYRESGLGGRGRRPRGRALPRVPPVGSPRASQPWAPTEPCVTISRYTALVVPGHQTAGTVFTQIQC